MNLGAQQQPGNRAAGRRIGSGGDVTDDGAVADLPGRPAKMAADLQALLVEQIGLRRLEGPREALVLRLADIDLDAVGSGLEQQGRALRRRHQLVGRMGDTGDGNERGGPAGNRSHGVPSSGDHLAATTSTSTSMPGSARPATTSRVDAG